MRFAAAINCMDGRTQLPVIRYLTARLEVAFVDMITAPGAVRWLCEETDCRERERLLAHLAVSLERHQAKDIAIVAHHDCAGNPLPDDAQKRQLQAAARFLGRRYPGCRILPLWLDAAFCVEELAAG